MDIRNDRRRGVAWQRQHERHEQQPRTRPKSVGGWRRSVEETDGTSWGLADGRAAPCQSHARQRHSKVGPSARKTHGATERRHPPESVRSGLGFWRGAHRGAGNRMACACLEDFAARASMGFPDSLGQTRRPSRTSAFGAMRRWSRNQSIQFSTRRPRTFSKSTRFRVSKVASWARQIAAILRSSVPRRNR